VADEGAQLAEISRRLEEAAGRLRDGGLSGDEATRLAGECADLASQAAAELERLARATSDDVLPGQEGLL
jgi:hypothetical protein